MPPPGRPKPAWSRGGDSRTTLQTGTAPFPFERDAGLVRAYLVCTMEYFPLLPCTVNR